VLAAHSDFVRPHHLAPPLFVAGLAGLAGASPLSRRARRALAIVGLAYGAGAVAAARSAARSRPELVPRLIACFPALHLGYGVGMIEGAAQKVRAGLGLGEPRTAVRER
jgi:hypothetical protein